MYIAYVSKLVALFCFAHFAKENSRTEGNNRKACHFVCYMRARFQLISCFASECSLVISSIVLVLLRSCTSNLASSLSLRGFVAVIFPAFTPGFLLFVVSLAVAETAFLCRICARRSRQLSKAHDILQRSARRQSKQLSLMQARVRYFRVGLYVRCSDRRRSGCRRRSCHAVAPATCPRRCYTSEW